MADYNVMLGLELESDAIQKIENKIKNIKYKWKSEEKDCPHYEPHIERGERKK